MAEAQGPEDGPTAAPQDEAAPWGEAAPPPPGEAELLIPNFTYSGAAQAADAQHPRATLAEAAPAPWGEAAPSGSWGFQMLPPPHVGAAASGQLPRRSSDGQAPGGGGSQVSASQAAVPPVLR